MLHVNFADSCHDISFMWICNPFDFSDGYYLKKIEVDLGCLCDSKLGNFLVEISALRWNRLDYVEILWMKSCNLGRFRVTWKFCKDLMRKHWKLTEKGQFIQLWLYRLMRCFSLFQNYLMWHFVGRKISFSQLHHLFYGGSKPFLLFLSCGEIKCMIDTLGLC